MKTDRALTLLATTSTASFHYEQFAYINNAIARENELKDWNREKKIALIEQNNPTWEDLAANL